MVPRVSASSIRTAVVVFLTTILPVASAFAQSASVEATSSNGVRACWDAHPCLRIGDRAVLSATAAIQADWWRSDVSTTAYEEEIRVRDVARRRVGLTIQLMRTVELRLEREFADTTAPWRDRYVNVRFHEALEFRAGSFMLPFGRDETTEAEARRFMFHSQAATLLAPGRDRGAMVHGSIARRRLGYELGRFDHDGANARTIDEAGRVSGGRTWAWRITARPWVPSSSRLGDLRVAVAGTTSDIPEGLPTINARSLFDVRYYASRVWVNGHQRRLGLDADWRGHGCEVTAETIRTWDERLGEGVEDNDLSPFEGQGWLVGGMCAVVGRRQDVGHPSLDNIVTGRGAGVVEVGGRLERVRFGSRAKGDEPATNPRADVIPSNGSQLVTIGLNWHINRWVRVQANAVRESFTDQALGPFPDRARVWTRLVRLQFFL